MQPRSAQFDLTVAGPHDLLVRADVLTKGRVVASGLPVASGSVQGDRGQFARRTCTVVIGDPGYSPSGAVGDLLAPYGNEVRLYRGAVTPAGPELICVGTFGIRSAEFDDGAAFTGISLTGIDRCKVVAETRFPFPRTTPAYSSALAQLRALLLEAVPWADIRVDPRVQDVTLPQVTWREDRAQAATDIVTSMGAEVFCDPWGTFVVQPIPSPADPPVFTVTGGPGGVLVAARHSLSRDGAHNGVVARGQSTGTDQEAPTSDLIVDDDPTSPTYWGGPFGKVVGFYDSSLLTTRDQANTVARALLLNNTGAARSLNYSTAVNAAQEPGDVVAVVDPGTGLVERHLSDQLTIPLDAQGVMTAQTRSTVTNIRLQPQYVGALT